MSGFSDEPVVIDAKRPWLRRGLILGGALFLVGMVLYPMLMQRWLEHRSHEAERGELGGAVYPVELEGETRRLELGWGGGGLAFRWEEPVDQPLRFRVKGSFGKDLLEWNPEYEVYGPGDQALDPFRHYRLRIIIETPEGEVLWSGKRWAYGIHTHAHEH